jgi:hypothetical protein
LPGFRFGKALDIARGVKALFKNPEAGDARGTTLDPERYEERGENSNTQQYISDQTKRLQSKRQELRRMRNDAHVTNDEAKFIEQRKRKKRIQQEIFELERELHAAQTGANVEEPATGALPDFVIIGGKKCGTTFLYHLLTQHPLVEPCAKKELHFFDDLFDESVEWYRRCFPQPRWEDSRKTITGEATPEYLTHPSVPERMAQVIPRARLIALLRNPVDRAYSDYQQVARKRWETRSFEEAVEAEEARIRGKRGMVPEDEHHASFEHQRFRYLTKSIYVDQLLRWSEFFPEEQMLVLKSEDFFEHPAKILKPVLSFLDLPDWEPDVPEFRDERDKEKYERIKRNKGIYEDKMDPATKQHLEEFFEPHNKRLYDYLGVDFGW